VDGYLLDTNVLVELLGPKSPHRKVIINKLKNIEPDSPLYIATPALAELEVGCHRTEKEYDEAQSEIRSTITNHGIIILEFTKHTAAEYGKIKAKLISKYNRKGKGKAKRPEEWPLPDTAATLGIDEFDLLMISHALERELVLVTGDSMDRIREGMGDLIEELHIDDWTETTQ